MYIENKALKKYISYWLGTMSLILSIMIIIGGLTRLTDSGLSITQWELFSGILPPLNYEDWQDYFDLYKKIPEYELQNYSMTLKEFKIIFWWEWIHRFLGRLIGLFFLIPLLYFSIKTGFKNLINLHLIFLLICVQGFIGWYMVSSGLVERVDVSHFRLSIHLLIAFLILSLILWNYFKLKNVAKNNIKLNFNLPFIFLILIFCQILIGAFVSGMDAGKIYNTWPLMGTTYFPNDSEVISLFNLKAFSDPSLVQFIHRNLAYLILVFYLFILVKIYKKKITILYKTINFIGISLIIQICLGILTLLYGAQIILASMHQISSIFLVSLSVYLFYINTNTNLQLSN
jgi:cytochrome c oxidase assembly protein subunit 15